MNSDLHKIILEYISFEITNGNYNEDSVESLEVAKQCLETAWGLSEISSSDSLINIYKNHLNPKKNVEKKVVTEADKKSAEQLKSQGNICMGENLYNEAVQCYSEAIETDPYNAVYYCNRAAAYTKLNRNETAVEDCMRALEIDNSYGKAYSRMGLAYTAMRNFTEAIKCYEKALEIEPNNENYRQNLDVAREQKGMQESGIGSGINSSSTSAGAGTGQNRAGSETGRGTATPEGTPPNMQNMLHNMDLNSILNNPAMMNMAQEFMSRPELRTMMSQMMNQMMGGAGGAGGAATNNTDPSPGNNQSSSAEFNNADSTANDATATPTFENILSFGQQFAQQMQTNNPELIERLRQRHNQQQNSSSSSSGNNVQNENNDNQ